MSNDKILALFLKHKSVSTDTRKITENSIFFALKGPNFNGNQFAEKAISLGASYAVIDEPQYQTEKTILVENSLLALQKLANNYRNTLQTKIIALTGSNGKTTTKELLLSALQTKFSAYGTPGNFNNHIGVPLTILQITPKTDLAIIEMGDNKPGDIAELCAITQPDIGFITNIGKDHIEGYGTMEKNIATKNELPQYLNKHKKPFFYSASSENIEGIAENCSSEFDVDRMAKQLKISQLKSNPFVRIKIDETIYETQLIGDYNFQNIIFSLCLSHYLNCDLHASALAICNYQPKINRSQLHQTESNQLILDAYNANPSSVENALYSFFKLETSLKKVVVLGDMLELGSIAEEEHLKMLHLLQAHPEVESYFIGKTYFQYKRDFDFSFFQNTAEAKEFFEKKAIKKALILLKGSRGIALENLIGAF